LPSLNVFHLIDTTSETICSQARFPLQPEPAHEATRISLLAATSALQYLDIAQGPVRVALQGRLRRLRRIQAGLSMAFA
jgi:hypothetical protein